MENLSGFNKSKKLSMKKHLLKSFLKINLGSTLVTFILAFIIQNFIIEHNGERMRNCYMPLFTELLIAFSCLFISFSSLTIFLNLFQNFRKNRLLTSLSFFLIPFITTVTFIILFFQEEFVDKKIILFLATLVIPVWFFIIWEYRKFIKNYFQ